MKPHPFLIIALVGALLGLMFTGVSTNDFAQHLDRQVHGLHCSFIPGLGEAETTGSDCEVTLMSPYSSIARDTVWGGVPISLPGMSVFAFLLFFAVDLLFGKRQTDKRATGFFALASLLPVLTSLVMAAIALGKLDAACKLCIGTYASSFLTFGGALLLWIRALRTPTFSPADVSASQDLAAADSAELDEAWAPPKKHQAGQPASYLSLAGAFGAGLMFVAVPVFAYVGAAPDHARFVGTCGGLEKEPADNLLIDVGPRGDIPALEVFDPLCPACRGFEEQLATTRFNDRLARKAVLFPLDAECNWMLDVSVHPGACAVSEAVLCADDDAEKVIAWAFENQEKILEASKANPKAAAKMVKAEFPEYAKCVGSPKAKARLNRSLRWAVDNHLRVLTPQLYVDGVRLCDEDVDLGLEYALQTMLDRRERGKLKVVEGK